jgi:hypothetical protein
MPSGSKMRVRKKRQFAEPVDLVGDLAVAYEHHHGAGNLPLIHQLLHPGVDAREVVG